MKHSLADLFDVAYRYYPKGILPDDPRYNESEECHRVVTARREAGAARGPWRAMLQRLRERFPELPQSFVSDRVLSCPGEWLWASYEGAISLPEAPGEHAHTVELRVSFLVPYYIIYATHLTDIPDPTGARRAWQPSTVRARTMDAFWALPPDAVKPDAVVELERELEEMMPPARRRDMSFDLSPEELTYGAAIAREIEATYGYEPMPPEIGKEIVPDVGTSVRWLGEASLYDLLMSPAL